MTRPDFVREMQKSLADQKRKADQDQREKLLDAEVIDKQSIKKWDELHREVKSLSEQIGIIFRPLEGFSFKLKNGAAELDVYLDREIKYTGMANGSFIPVVVRGELAYCPKESYSESLRQFGLPTLTVEQVAEKLVRMVVVVGQQ